MKKGIERIGRRVTKKNEMRKKKMREDKKEVTKEDSKEVVPEVKEESKTKRYSDKRKEERLKREREKAEKKKRDDGIVTIIDVEDESSKDDVTEGLTEAVADLDLKGAAAPESNDLPPQVEREKKVKKSYRERREERERRNERKEAADDENKEMRKSEEKETEREKKDRKFKKPDMQIYRPGMGKFSSRSLKKDEEGKSPKTSPEESRESSPNKKPSRSEKSSRNQSPDEKKGKSKKKYYEDYYYEDDKSYTTKEYYGKKKGSGSEEPHYDDTRPSKGSRGGGSKSYRANREAKLERKKREGGEAEDKEAAKDSTDSRIETDTSIDQDCGGKNEKVIEKADQECMEKPANNNQETAEKASVNQHAKQTEGENSCSSPVKPVEIDDSKADVKSVARQSMPADDDI